MGLGENKNQLYLIDFGLAKKFRTSENLQHVKFKDKKKLTGTARYASLKALRGLGNNLLILLIFIFLLFKLEQSRRDDLEAIGYVLIYFLKGRLPWQGIKLNNSSDRYKKLYEKKKSTSSDELCAGFPSK